MKTRTIVLIPTLLICILFMSNCATTSQPAKPGRLARISEPSNSNSTLLIGRITLTCENFPKSWHVEGEYKKGISIDLQDQKTGDIFTLKSRGSQGLFYVLDRSGNFEIKQLTFVMGGGRSRTTLYYRSRYPLIINIEKGKVNNMGDMLWTETFEEITERETHKATGKTHSELRFIKNYSEVKNWFGESYPDSGWNKGSWINL